MTLLAAEIIQRPVVSEKSMDHTNRAKYTFQVHPDANKLQVKQAVEELFKVDVLGVNVLTTKAKEKTRGRRRGRNRGWTSPWKKAVVTIAAGQKIEFFEGV
ncbi:MAG TPA: 50S ribosomal protein L23 [Candidatus Limnocylindria bacterium]|jgi:large subunit ribosomal protein L23|nr:50S ribosomal protein L23 [Candidatus Limnocylindria bacterium]